MRQRIPNFYSLTPLQVTAHRPSTRVFGDPARSREHVLLAELIRFGDFEWDEAKARVNLRKHGVSFSEAATCFLDPRAFTAPDKEYTDRFILIGFSRHLRVLFVVSAEAGERIRIISARKASPVQRKVYEHGP